MSRTELNKRLFVSRCLLLSFHLAGVMDSRVMNSSATNLQTSALNTSLPNPGLQPSSPLNPAFSSTALSGSSSQGRNIVIFVADGLRNGSVNPEDAPTLYSLRQLGVNFTNSHSLFPTFTTPNASAIATGHYLGDTGDFSNTIYSGFPTPNAGLSPTPFIENNPILGDLNAQYKGQFDASDPDTFSFYNFLNEETLLQVARQNGYSTAAIGKVGPTLIQDVTQGNRGPDGTVPVPQTIVIDDSTGRTGGIPLSTEITQRLTQAGLPTTAPDRSNGYASTSPLSNGNSGNNTTPGTQAANLNQQQFFVDATTKAVLPYFQQQGKPFAMVYWSRDPDGTQHNQGDSLDSLTPGINGPTSKAAVKNADDNLAQLIQALKADGLYDNTDIFVTSDHGFSTISKTYTDTQGGRVSDYASSLTYAGVNPGYLPAGFVAIDLAHDLGLNLYDPDTKSTDGKSYAMVDPTQGQKPKAGNGLIGGSGLIPTNNDAPDAQVVVAANGGSDLIYVPDHNVETVKKVVDFLSKQAYTSGLFVDDSFGPIAGTLPISSINLKGSAQTPTPAIVLNFRTFATDASNPFQSQVEIADTGLQQGQGMHGSFGRGDTFNNMIAIGPDFKQGYADLAPVSNADVAVTLAHVLGLPISQNGSLIGRVIQEALVGGPDKVATTTGVLTSTPDANGVQTILNYQQVGDTKYFDAAGYAGRTVGLNANLQGDGIDGQKTFVINRGDRNAVIDHFGGVGQGVNPNAATIAEADTLKFVGDGLIAKNMILTQQGSDLVITFDGVSDTQVTLKNFKLKNLDNLSKSTGATVNLDNILFNGQTQGSDSFDVFNNDAPRNRVYNPNTVTFLDRVSKDVYGLNHSDNVINAVQGNHTIHAGDGNDLLRGGAGRNTLYGGTGTTILEGGSGRTRMIGGTGKDTFVLSATDGLDIVKNFDLSKDRIQLAGGLTYDQLSLTQGSGQYAGDILISLKQTGRLLAVLDGDRPGFLQGVAAGDVTSNDAILWTRTSDPITQQGVASQVKVQVSTDPTFKSQVKTLTGVTDASRDYTLKLDATGLKAGTTYYYRFETGKQSFSSVGQFKTAPNPDQAVPVSFGFSGDADGQWRPYGSLNGLQNQNLDYFVFLGDTIYESKNARSAGTADPLSNPTQAKADYERKYRENLTAVNPGGFTGDQVLYQSQGTYVLLDNHELGNKQFINGGAPAGTPAGKGADATNPAFDVNATGTFINQTPGFQALLQAYDEYQPIRETTVSAPNDPRSNSTQKLYYAQQWGANSLFINVDDRSYRDIRLKTAAGADDTGSRADNPDRTMLGKTQLAWLEQTLLDAQKNGTPWKFVALSSPIDETGDDGGKSWAGGYRAERNELLKFIADHQIQNVVFLSTDDHQNRVNELTYLADPSNPASRTRVPGAFTIVAGPIGAGGPDAITDHSFANLQKLTDAAVATETSKGLDPLGLDPANSRVHDLFREGDPQANQSHSPIDFYSPDTFNYAKLDVSADGKTLSVNLYGINSYAANTFPEPSAANPVRRILGFQIDATK